jgi:hypothetical protein
MHPDDFNDRLKELQDSALETVMEILSKAYDDDVYERNTDPRKHKGARNRLYANKALKWVLSAFRTLTIDELKHAVSRKQEISTNLSLKTLSICSLHAAISSSWMRTKMFDLLTSRSGNI